MSAWQRKAERFASTYAALIMAYHLLYASGILTWLNIDLGGVHGAISMGLLMSLLYLTIPAKRPPKAEAKSDGSTPASESRIGVMDLALAILCLLPPLYYTLNFERTLYSSLTPNTMEIALGLMFLFLLFEGARRAVGLPITLVGLVFFAYPLLAPHLPGVLFASQVSGSRLVGELYLGTQGIFASVANTFATVIAVFIIFGQIFDVSRGGNAFLDLALSFLGSKRGGPAKAAVIGSAAFGTMSGVAVANVVTTGTITIPLMKRTGFDKDYAGAVEAVASTGGALMPPVMGVLAFIMADFLQVPYWTIATSAIVPAVLYYIAVYVQVDLQAAKLGLVGLPRESLPRFKDVIPQAWPYFLPLLLMLYMFMVLGWSATRVGFWVVALMFSIYAVTNTLRTHDRNVPRPGTSQAIAEVGLGTATAFSRAGKMLASIIPAAGVAGIIMGAVNITALGLRLSGSLVTIAGNSLFLLLILAAFACYLMGTAIDLVVIYLVLAVLVAPALVKMGVLPIAAHLFILYYTVAGLITPPVCMSVFAACAISGGNVFRTGFQAMKLGFVALVVPFMFVYHPTLLLRGAPTAVAFDVASAMVGVVGVATALEGYFFTGFIGPLARLVIGVGGFLCIYPSATVSILGLAIMAGGALLSVTEIRRRAPARTGAVRSDRRGVGD